MFPEISILNYTRNMCTLVENLYHEQTGCLPESRNVRGLLVDEMRFWRNFQFVVAKICTAHGF